MAAHRGGDRWKHDNLEEELKWLAMVSQDIQSAYPNAVRSEKTRDRAMNLVRDMLQITHTTGADFVDAFAARHQTMSTFSVDLRGPFLVVTADP